MPFDVYGVQVEKDEHGTVRSLEHLRAPYRASGAAATVESLSDEYLREVAPLYGLRLDRLAAFDPPKAFAPSKAETTGLVRSSTQTLPTGSAVVGYVQTHSGLMVWESGIAVTVIGHPMRVVSSRSTHHGEFKLANAEVLGAKNLENVGAVKLARALGLQRNGGPLARGPPRTEATSARPRITSTRLLIYRYEPAHARRI